MFAGDVILAGGNLGSAVTKLLASSDARLVVVERTENSLARVMGGLAAPGVHLGVPSADLRDPSACQALADQALQRFGRIDGLVHAVGSFAVAELAAADPIHWTGLFETNVITTLNICRAFVPVMRAAGRGSIVTIGAVGAYKTGKGMAAYAASKSAVLRLTESLAHELKADGVRAQLRPAQHH